MILAQYVNIKVSIKTLCYDDAGPASLLSHIVVCLQMHIYIYIYKHMQCMHIWRKTAPGVHCPNAWRKTAPHGATMVPLSWLSR